jgi:uncharacterized protein YuzE
MPPEVFDVYEARALQGHRLYTTQDFKDEFDRVLIPANYHTKVIGIDVWREDDGVRSACIVIQFAGHEQDGLSPKVVLVNRSTFHAHFVDISVQTP